MTKTLNLTWNQQGDGMMLSLMQSAGGTRTNVSVPLTRAEYTVCVC